MFCKLDLINKNQRGFTLVEILVAITIMSIIGLSTTVAIGQVFNLNSRSIAHMTAITEVDSAIRWISHDAQMAQTVETGLDSSVLFSLTWVEWDNTEHQVIYALEDGKLKRRHYLNSILTDNTTVAQHIDSDSQKTKCELSGCGTFNLPDAADAFTITGGLATDNGTINVTAGSISVTTTGTATYSTGDWTAPAAGDNVTVNASGAGTQGSWTSTAAIATVTITTDDDGDAIITGNVLIATITATVNDGSQSASETRVCRVSPRSSL